MQNFTQGQFIKSYDVLSTLEIIPTERLLLELILSYQLADLAFYMNHSNIAKKLGVTTKYVGKMLSKLSTLGYVIINTQRKLKVLNGINCGGSISFIKADVAAIQSDIDKITSREESKTTVKENIVIIEHPEIDVNEILDYEKSQVEKEEDNDGFSDPELIKKMAESISKRIDDPLSVIEDKKKKEIEDMNDEFNFVNEDEEKLDFNEIKEKIKEEENIKAEQEKSLQVQPKDKEISIKEYFKILKKNFPTTEKTLDEMEEFLKNAFQITMYNDEKLSSEAMKSQLNKEIQVFRIDHYKYLQLF